VVNLPKVSCKFGAPMGRDGLSLDKFLAEYAGNGKVKLGRVELNSGGYDSGGAYWGCGVPLWRAAFTTSDGCEEVETFFRAYSREAAKAKLPGAKFYR
jgi:hypothetical protein